MNWNYKTPGISDEHFIRGKVPMTKEEIRTITLSKLRLKEKDTVIDIGAGTGSISIEAALIANKGIVYSLERKEEAIELIKQNTKKFNIKNIKIVQGEAPASLDGLPCVDRAILGGTGGKLKEIMDWLDKNLRENGRIVINGITIETVHNSIKTLKKRKYKNIDVTQVQISKGSFVGKYTMMKGQNPIYIISADRFVHC